ncbi:hypothetical protein [Pseudomonas paraveronii]|uniref:hypothetical protein n=1 Tax=Pseudomonas paraveronii TaxID=3040598 RepID=UPI002AB29ACA|nr:hypothetical protein [Pseudomonas sp. V3/K/3/5]
MNFKLCVAMSLLSFTLADCVSAQQLSSQQDIYVVNQKAKNLTVSWSGGSKTVEGVVGSQGETTKALVTFDGKKALRYENLASSSAFEAYFTLVRHGNDIFVDCIYTNVRNNQNGMLINKAVCGLEKPLIEDYEDLVYEFTDEWKNSTAEIDLDPLLKTPPAPLEVEEADFGNVKLSRIYKTQEDLSSSVPETVINNGSKKYSFGMGLVFPVYRFGNLSSPAYLEVSAGDSSKKFIRYDAASLSELL